MIESSKVDPTVINHFQNAKEMTDVEIENELFELMAKKIRRAAGVMAVPTSARRH
jgi:hypothetical protein